MSVARHETFMMRFEVDVQPARDVVCVRPSGELDLYTVGMLRQRIEELTGVGFARVLLDLREITFLDSSGVHLVLELAEASLAEDWELGVLDGTPAIRRVFDVAGVRPLVPFIDVTDGHWGRA